MVDRNRVQLHMFQNVVAPFDLILLTRAPMTGLGQAISASSRALVMTSWSVFEGYGWQEAAAKSASSKVEAAKTGLGTGPGKGQRTFRARSARNGRANGAKPRPGS